MSEERNENEVFEEVTQETVSQEEVADVDEAVESTDAVDSTAEVVEAKIILLQCFSSSR